PLAPVLAVAPAGFVLALRRGHRAPAVAAAAIAVYYILMNASYEGWFGGWNYGPRDLAPAIPFLALLVAPIWARGPGALRMLLVAAAVWGAGSSLMAVSTMVQPPNSIKRPFDDLLWPAFRAGRLSLNPMGYRDIWADPHKLLDPGAHHAAWNLGQRVGLDGHLSLAPLYAAWLAGVVWLWRRARPERRPPSPSASSSPAVAVARPRAGRRRVRRRHRARRVPGPVTTLRPAPVDCRPMPLAVDRSRMPSTVGRCRRTRAQS